MFFIDGEEYPSLNGTGTEDYFNHAWGMQRNAYPFFGTIVHEGDTDGFQVSYRWHITDPVRFNKHLKVTIEHGHANQLSDDWSSTAYWYQALPTATPITIAPVEDRLPVVPQPPERKLVPPAFTEGRPRILRKALEGIQAASRRAIQNQGGQGKARIQAEHGIRQEAARTVRFGAER